MTAESGGACEIAYLLPYSIFYILLLSLC